MSLQQFISEALSPWTKIDGPDSDIVLSSRIRLARNLEEYTFPLLTSTEEAYAVSKHIGEALTKKNFDPIGRLELLPIDEMKANEKRVLVEKHLISPHLANHSKHGAVLLDTEESVSIMINEEDHIRIQCLFPGFQLEEGLKKANDIDDWIEGQFNICF